MITLRESPILNVTLRALFPMVVLYSVQLFSYGANSPGGGFQAGVVFGTIVVAMELMRGRRLYSQRFFQGMEVAGMLLLAGLAAAGWARTGHPLGGFYHWTARGDLFSNVYLWLLNAAIFCEVAGSLVLIFRHLMEWDAHAARDA